MIESHGPTNGAAYLNSVSELTASAGPTLVAAAPDQSGFAPARDNESAPVRTVELTTRIEQPWEPGRRNWPELTVYAYRGGVHQLRFFLRNAGAGQRESVSRGSYEFGLNVYPDLAFLFFRPRGEDQWHHVPVSWWTLPEAGQIPPGADMPSKLELVLIDCETGLLLATGCATLGNVIARQLNACLNQQANSPHAFLRTGKMLEAALMGAPQGAKLVPTLVETN